MAHVLITGGADGIGRALVEQYAQAGNHVTIIDRDLARAQALCQSLQVQGHSAAFVHADLRTADPFSPILHTLSSMPRIDIVVHSAGISAVGPFAASQLDRQQAVLDINLRAPIQLTTGLLREGLVAPGGTLVFIASLSVFMSYPGAAVYAASKDGIAAYARSLRVALARQSINVLTVVPGPTRTAHARRYSPDNRREGRRMPPAQLAGLIVQAVQQRQALLIPGTGNRIGALVGRLLPGLAEYLMRKTILEKLPAEPLQSEQP